MIKASALLVALAIGLLVAGVVASSLLMVYVSIGVCAVAALLLAAGVLSHWPEIFGRGEPRPSGMQESWAAPQAQVGAPVLATTQAAGTQTTGAAGPEERRPRREDAGGRPPAPPAEVVLPQAESAAAGRNDDLWERVEEELGSAGKRDTGALSWPGTELPVPPESAGPPGAPPDGGASAWIWGHGAGWHPPGTPDDAWPPPAAAFAGSPARPEPATSTADSAGEAGQDTADPGLGNPDPDGPDPDSTQPADGEPASPEPARPPAASAKSADTGRTAEAAGQPAPEAPAAGPARDTEQAAPGSVDDEAAEPDPNAAPVTADTWDERPRWIISVGDAAPARPVPNRAVPETVASERTAERATGPADIGEPEAGEPPAGEPDAKIPAAIAPASAEAPAQAAAGQEPASREPAADGPAADRSAADEPADREAVAQQSAAGSPAEPETAAGEPAAGRPDGPPGPGRVDVTVVPGVARYHRSGCILIRFLGAGDLEIMSRQEAEEATFVPCRACQPDQLES